MGGAQTNASAGQNAHAANAPITGVWRGQMDNLPGVVLTITDEGGSLAGGVLFYLHMRQDVNHPWTSTPGLPEPMLNPKFDGTTLTFQISHRRAHPPRTLNDPPVRFHMTLLGPNKAGLVNESDAKPGETSPGVLLVRSDY
jgi:hypothetical protein